MVVLGGGQFLMSEVPLQGSSWGAHAQLKHLPLNDSMSASEQRANDFKGFKDFNQKDKARIWP